MPEVQPSVAEKIERQVTMATDADAAATERRAERVEGWRTHIRQFPALEIAPDQFDRVQLRGVAWQTTGCCERPLSSSKTIQARRRRAFFLAAASAASSRS